MRASKVIRKRLKSKSKRDQTSGEAKLTESKKPSSRKGKTNVELFGPERAKEIGRKIAKRCAENRALIGNRKVRKVKK